MQDVHDIVCQVNKMHDDQVLACAVAIGTTISYDKTMVQRLRVLIAAEVLLGGHEVWKKFSEYVRRCVDTPPPPPRPTTPPKAPNVAVCRCLRF